MSALQDAVAAAKAGRIEQAEELCAAILAQTPGHMTARLLAANLAVSARKPATAAAHLHHLIQDPQAAGDILHQAGLLLRQCGDASGAVRALERSLKNSSNSFAALLDLADAQQAAGDTDAALRNYDLAIEVNPGQATAFSRRAMILLRARFGDPRAITRSGTGHRGMITMRTLGDNGRFANQLFQYAFLRCYARVHDLEVQVPDWVGAWLFDLDDPHISAALPIARESPDLAASLRPGSSTGASDCDFQGYFCFHTRAYEPHRDFIRSLFRPGWKFAGPLSEIVNALRPGGRTLVTIHLRRGDFGYGKFWIAPESWYRAWLDELWPTLENPVLYIATDEPAVMGAFADYRPIGHENIAPIVPGLAFIEDFFILSQADVLAISNSTFSFFAALLNTRATTFARPDPKAEKLVGFDPWASEVLL